MIQRQNKNDQELLKELYFREEEDTSYRAAVVNPGVERGPSKTTQRRTQQQKEIQKLDSMQSSNVWNVQDKTFLDQHVFLNQGIEADAVFEFLLQAITEIAGGFKNYREFPEEKKVVGYHFDETRVGAYRVEVFEHNEQLGLNCTRLEGDTLAVTDLWDLVKRELMNSDFIPMGMDMGETDDEGFFGSDDEFEDFDMDSFKYMDFTRDPAFVGRLIDEIGDLNVGTHSLMLLAFNCQNSSNLDYLSGNHGQALFDSILRRLGEAEGSTVTLPVARSSAWIIKHIVAQADSPLNITAAQVKIILSTIDFWAFENAPKRSITPTASEEATILLSEALGDIQNGTYTNYQDELNQIVNGTQFDTVKDALAPLLIATN